MSSFTNRKESVSSEKGSSTQDPPLAPAMWDLEILNRNWVDHLENLSRQSNVPFGRLRFQSEHDPAYLDAVRRWEAMDGAKRVGAWKSLIELSDRQVSEMLPSCVQCGECCRNGSPTLQLEDLDLFREEKLPADCLITIRRGEPVHSPIENKLAFLVDERIKIREKSSTSECVFWDGATSLCSIYANRPIQCRAQACWDPSRAEELASQPYLTRNDIFRGVEVLMGLIVEHDKRCGFEQIQAAFKRLEETRGETVDEVLEILAYEEHFRDFVSEQLNIPQNIMDLVLGRSFEELVAVFGFRASREADGSKCLTVAP